MTFLLRMHNYSTLSIISAYLFYFLVFGFATRVFYLLFFLIFCIILFLLRRNCFLLVASTGVRIVVSITRVLVVEGVRRHQIEFSSRLYGVSKLRMNNEGTAGRFLFWKLTWKDDIKKKILSFAHIYFFLRMNAWRLMFSQILWKSFFREILETVRIWMRYSRWDYNLGNDSLREIFEKMDLWML